MIGLLTVTLLLAAQPTVVLAQSSSSGSHAQSSTTRLLPVSGSLTDASGAPLSGTVIVTFTLYDAAEHGMALWRETQQVQVDDRGRYAAYLGASTPVPQAAFSQERARWLGVEVDGRELPRVMLVAVPYALRAADAETLGGKPLSEFVLTEASGRRVRADGTTIDDPAVDGTGVPNQIAKWSTATTLSSSIITESFDNRLGILTPDPTGGGVVDSRLTIRNPDNNTALGILSPLNQRRFALNTNANGSWTLFDGSNGTWNRGLTQAFGRVSIGPVGPSAFAVLVAGSFTIPAVQATSEGSIALIASTQTGLAAIRAINEIGGQAAIFDGGVDVNGTLTKTAGSFRIDHPLDPANKYLSHSFVESPDMMNVYNGNIVLDAKGEAWVTLPDWFEALNRDFRYQLTAIGRPANPYIAEEVRGNRFKIAGGVPGGKVSWQVTGIRQDAYANAHRIAVEEDKPDHERGFYLYPQLFGLPPTLVLPSRRIDPTSMSRR